MIIEDILNRVFLIRIVSIETLQFNILSRKNDSKDGPDNFVELKLMAIEPALNSKLSENIYALVLKKVTMFNCSFDDLNERTLEFDVDEINLEKEKSDSQKYILRFQNNSVTIEISFDDLSLQVLTKSEFTEEK